MLLALFWHEGIVTQVSPQTPNSISWFLNLQFLNPTGKFRKAVLECLDNTNILSVRSMQTSPLPDATMVLAHNVFSILRLSWMGGSLSSCSGKKKTKQNWKISNVLFTFQVSAVLEKKHAHLLYPTNYKYKFQGKYKNLKLQFDLCINTSVLTFIINNFKFS